MVHRRRQSGFSLLELAVSIAIMAMMTAATVPSYMEGINEMRANLTAQETQSILDAARAYRAEKGGWPGAPLCANALSVLQTTSPPFIGGISSTNKYKSPITTSCTTNTFSVDQNIIKDWEGVVANSLPGTTVVSTATSLIRSTVSAPGSESGLNDKLSRTAQANAELNRMRTTLLMGNNNITEVNNLDTVSVTASGMVSAQTLSSTGRATVGDLAIMGSNTESATCSPNGLVSRTAGGTPLNCTNGRWVKQVAYNPGTVTTGQGCGDFAKGSIAFDSSGKMFICK
ncbi:type II secretion system protein [Pseudomonas mosselii]|uniref:type II secretion system protein n=1 Tax=Pseudomonas mosselii TaxID=78327 RepID=UPI0021D9F3C9|nr:prepilin-type N-terminal cleavage/methylation domain-containing protein [Pseudomonas mosselii]MCU9528348.1 prepilin-type N-terminal cleavage/methylation domain-containing protein [Pseudomonas mosselii]MCU9535521.1 prepilin-type N-terminal cleavage/methylation domain-containing protein [Pseudomonas mosselii]MCU9543419.1 prepilin-type N-terminal cleavage/methylation domain-containing protein [Pseudomonas mosselii]MCU9547372.1 prepilin-type N-terminal cleavage/methylation domain-containing prot